MADLLVTAGVTKRYGGLLANDGVAVTLQAGELRALIGPNGAGKTTFVNIITGIERPDTGALADVPITGLAHLIAAQGRCGSGSRWRACSATYGMKPDGDCLGAYRGTAEGRARRRAAAL